MIRARTNTPADPQTVAHLLWLQDALDGAALRLFSESSALLGIFTLPRATRASDRLHYPALPATRVKALGTGVATRFDIVGKGGVVLVDSPIGSEQAGFRLRLGDFALVSGHPVDVVSLDVKPVRSAATNAALVAGGS